MIWKSIFGLLVILATVGGILLTGKSSSDPQSMIIAKKSAKAAAKKAEQVINDHQGVLPVVKAKAMYKKAGQAFKRAESKEKENLLEAEKLYKKAKVSFNKSRVETYKQAADKAHQKAQDAQDKVRKIESQIYAKAKAANSEMEAATKLYKTAGQEKTGIGVSIDKYISANSKFEMITREFSLIIAAMHAESEAVQAYSEAKNQGLSEAHLKKGHIIAKTGEENLLVENFEMAIRDFEEAKRQFKIAMNVHKQASAMATIAAKEVTVVLGSTAEEVQSAMALCLKYQEGCMKQWYASESLRQVQLSPFEMDRYEATYGEFAEFTQATGYKTVAENKGYSERWTGGMAPEKAKGYSWKTPEGPSSSYLNKINHPVGHMSWHDANAYCQYAGKRLPTEDEWEYAAREFERNIFPWGNHWIAGNVLQGGSDNRPVGSYPSGSTPGGLLDMAGSVWEWTSSKVGEKGVLKGSSWVERNPANFRSAMQRLEDLNMSYHDDGFRCVRDVGQYSAGLLPKE